MGSLEWRVRPVATAPGSDSLNGPREPIPKPSMKKSRTDIADDEYHPQCLRASNAPYNPTKFVLLPQIRRIIHTYAAKEGIGMQLQIALALIFGILGAVGVYLTYRSLVQQRDLRYSWDDIHRGVTELYRKVADSNWKPELLVTVTGSGAIVANLFMKIMSERLPLYGIMLEDRRKPWKYAPPAHRRLEAGRWWVNVPEALLEEGKEKNILIVDSMHFSGQTMKAIKDLLAENGFRNVKHACFLRLENPQGATEEPDYCVHRSSKSVFYYPWGKG
jgi:hypoxanthine phosphoribosyltransferase